MSSTSVVFWVAVIFTATSFARQATFSSGTDAVRVDVSVTRSNRPVLGLTAADFELKDDDVLQHVDVLSVENVSVHLVLAIDTSGSVRGAALDHLKDAAHSAVAQLRPGDSGTLLTFSHRLQRLQGSFENRALLDRGIDALAAGGSTSLVDAAFAALATRGPTGSRPLALIFTDGEDTSSWLNPAAVVDTARRSDVVVNGIVLEGSASSSHRQGPILPGQRRRWFLEEPQLFRRDFLPILAEQTGGEIIVARGSSDLNNAFVSAITAFRTRYVLTYSPRDVATSGWHDIEVRLKKGKGNVHARPGYLR